jgi:hypothetical protein
MKTLRARPVPVPGDRAVMSQDGRDGDRRARRAAIMRWFSSAGLVLPRRTRWHDLTGRQRAMVITRGTVQIGLLAAALKDLRRRPADAVRGPKVVWVVVSGVNYLGLGPLAYFAFGRRRPAPGISPDADHATHSDR